METLLSEIRKCMKLFLQQASYFRSDISSVATLDTRTTLTRRMDLQLPPVHLISTDGVEMVVRRTNNLLLSSLAAGPGPGQQLVVSVPYNSQTVLQFLVSLSWKLEPGETLSSRLLLYHHLGLAADVLQLYALLGISIPEPAQEPSDMFANITMESERQESRDDESMSKQEDNNTILSADEESTSDISSHKSEEGRNTSKGNDEEVNSEQGQTSSSSRLLTNTTEAGLEWDDYDLHHNYREEFSLSILYPDEYPDQDLGQRELPEEDGNSQSCSSALSALGLPQSKERRRTRRSCVVNCVLDPVNEVVNVNHSEEATVNANSISRDISANEVKIPDEGTLHVKFVSDKSVTWMKDITKKRGKKRKQGGKSESSKKKKLV